MQMGFFKKLLPNTRRFDQEVDKLAKKFKCPDCDCMDAVTHSISTASGGAFSRIFDANSNGFDCLICKQCGLTKLYARDIAKY